MGSGDGTRKRRLSRSLKSGYGTEDDVPFLVLWDRCPISLLQVSFLSAWSMQVIALTRFGAVRSCRRSVSVSHCVATLSSNEALGKEACDDGEQTSMPKEGDRKLGGMVIVQPCDGTCCEAANVLSHLINQASPKIVCIAC
jgi:hypothetical protein